MGVGRQLAVVAVIVVLMPGLDGMVAPLQARWKIGRQTALVDHLVSDTEWAFCSTDAAMAGRTRPGA